jgi:hypothetical protein
MPKNIMKIHLFMPKRSAPVYFSIHFDTKYLGGMFYFELSDFSEDILTRAADYINMNISTRNKVFAPSVKELTGQLNDIIKACTQEYVSIEESEVIALSYNSTLNLSSTDRQYFNTVIESSLLKKRVFLKEDNSIYKIQYFSLSRPDKEFHVKDSDNFIFMTKSPENEAKVLSLFMEKEHEFESNMLRLTKLFA